MSERQWQNGFERYKDRLSAIGTFKDGHRDGTHVTEYRDLGDEEHLIDSDGDAP